MADLLICVMGGAILVGMFAVPSILVLSIIHGIKSLVGRMKKKEEL
jgi:hypothetical protein